MTATDEQVERRAMQLHEESCESRGVSAQWSGRGTNRTYYRRLARAQLEWRA